MSMKTAQAPTPAIADTGRDNPNCVNNIVAIAADTMAMQRSTKPSRRADAGFASVIGAVSTAGAGVSSGVATPGPEDAAGGLELSRLLIVFYAANRFVSDQLRRPWKRDAMRLP